MSCQLDPNRLWAKRWRGNGRKESAYLPGHLKDVHEAALLVLDATAEAQLASLTLAATDWLGRFRRVVSLAAALHDLGKCNSQFQNMLRRDDYRQALRHEWVTWLILNDRELGLRDWLLSALDGEEDDWRILCWSIAGHHPRYDRSAPPDLADGPMKLSLPLDHPDVIEVLQGIGDTFHLGKPPELSPRAIDLGVGGSEALDELYQSYYEDENRYDEMPRDLRRMLAAAKDCLVAADVAGSALPRDVEDDSERSHWIGAVLGTNTLPTAADYREIVAKRLKCPSDGVAHRLRPFQRDTAEKAGRVTFVRAGCGTGKTLAAYRWAEACCPGKRLYISYPTTGTATEGFRDYLLDPGLAQHVKTNLEHGRRAMDFMLLQADEDRNSDLARIESLDLWRTPIVACTVDTVLGVVQNNRRGLFGWPALAQGGFVFDEIHSYDDKLFDALLHFLDAVRGVPVLLMTASLPDHRRTAIEHVLARHDEKLVEIPGPSDIEQRPRYRHEEVPAKELAGRIKCEIGEGGKVLRVCNTVDAAMREADALGELSLAPILYHSRFRYVDRVRRHQAVIDAFDPTKNSGPALAVCTQVAEMSLDLSATLLVTDLAPVPSLIQRLGRLNRRTGEGDPTRPFIVADPLDKDGKFSPLPYDADDLEAARQWLSDLGDGELSQKDLADAWIIMQETSAEVPRYQSAWLDFGPATPVLELREGSPSITVVLEEDLPALKSKGPSKKTLAEVALPMPVPPAKKGGQPFDWQLRDAGGLVNHNGVPVARNDAIDYDPKRGATWAK